MDTTAPLPYALPDHPQRLSLAWEVHARPYEVLDAPVRVSHVAVLLDDHDAAALTHLKTLLDHFGAPHPRVGATHASRDLGGGLRVRWEQHTEFASFTFYQFGAPEFGTPEFGTPECSRSGGGGAAPDPFATPALSRVPADWLRTLPGEVLVAVHAAVLPGDDTPDLPALFAGHLVTGARIGGGAASAWSDFHLHADGFARILMTAGTLTPGQIGRHLQRLLEIETYRMKALLALPIARTLGATLSRLEHDTASLTARMAAPLQEGEDREVLGALTTVAAEVEWLMAEHSYRFGASRAYSEIVSRCLQDLRQDRLPGLQTLTEFMERRFSPAMRTVEAMAGRADALGRRVARASDLLRTRVDIALEENNRDLLRSMNQRAQLQLRLQETVEGLSVVAISYYAWGLLGYLLKGIKTAGVPLNPDLAALGLIPAVVLGVAWGLRRMKRRLHGPAATDP